MNEPGFNEAPKKCHGYLDDRDGNHSSGRLMKLIAFVFAIIMTVVGVILIHIYPDHAQLVTFLVATIGMFIGVATASEIAQKASGR